MLIAISAFTLNTPTIKDPNFCATKSDETSTLLTMLMARALSIKLCVRCRGQFKGNLPRRLISTGKTHKEKGGSYFTRLKWIPIPVTVGFAYIGYQQYGHIKQREERKLNTISDPEELLANDWTVTFYKCLPLKILSRAWGRLNSLELPVFMRTPLLKLYIRLFNCNMEEAAVRDLEHYKNLKQLFSRRLKPGTRPVDKHCSVVCPSDGRVLHFDRAKNGLVEQVKGITYALQDLIGPTDFSYAEETSRHVGKLNREVYHKRLKKNAENELFHCVIYLAPGDYHGFHSPAEWTIANRRHFPGELFSVNPGICRLIRGLFNLNERTVYAGEWEHGFFSMIPVGATNVGSIKIYHDKTLETNMPYKYPAGAFFDQSFCYSDTKGIPMKRGDAFGEFNLGSTIVLVFEAPPSFEFEVEPGQVIKYGQPLGRIKANRNERKG